MMSAATNVTPVDVHQIEDRSTAGRVKQTFVFDREAGPLFVDRWQGMNSADAAPVLLIHGWGGTGSYWREMAVALSETVPVIVPDLPGTGRSQPVNTAQDIYDQVETLGFLLEAMQLERVQVVGHSMGGAMAVLLTAAHPERVERLVLTAMTFFMTQAQVDLYHRIMGMFRLSMRFRPEWLVDVPGMSRMMATHYFHRIPNNPAVLRQGLRDYLQLERSTALACASNATDDSIRQAGALVDVPTLLIASRQDQMMPLENVDFTAEIIGDCQVRWIEECGHLPMVEKPDEYLSLLRGFLQL
jgi:pimeloyl-ACP methyl ester carboxylesterase